MIPKDIPATEQVVVEDTVEPQLEPAPPVVVG
jgi:hypothetical protein